MGGSAFVDTNVLLRTMIPLLPHHTESEALIQYMLRNGTTLWINRQVIRESLVRATHPGTFNPPYSMPDALGMLDQIVKVFKVADETAEVTRQLVALLKTIPTTGKQIHDANLVATMLANNIPTLLTLNKADFARFGTRIIVISPLDSYQTPVADAEDT